jgi:hypothetical protein
MNILIIILFIGTLAFIYFWQKRQDKAEENRFREFVIASKAKNVEDYVTAIPSRDDSIIPQQEELHDIDNIDPEVLLNAIKQEHQEN